MRVFHGALFEIVRHAHIVVRTENQARAFACEPRAYRFDFLRGRFLLGDQMIEAEHHQRVGIVENAGVDRKLLTRLIDALVHGHWMPGQLANQLLETKQRQMEQFERAGDALQEHLCGVLRSLIRGPGHATHFGDCGEAIVHLGHVAIRFPRVAPRPVDAETASSRRVRTRNFDLVVGAGTGFRSHDTCSA